MNTLIGCIGHDCAECVARAQSQPPAAEPVATWKSRRMVNTPHPSEHGMRIVGFVVPTDSMPLGMISEKLDEIIGIDPRVAEYRELLRDVLGVFAGDFEINPRDVRERIAAALKGE